MVPVADIEDAKPIRLLLVEDDPLVRATPAEGLREFGLSVVEAANAAEALAYLAATDDIEVVFTDIRMPGALDGVGLVQRLRETHPALPVILTSANENLGNIAGSAPFIRKPYRVAHVATLVATLVGKSPADEPNG